MSKEELGGEPFVSFVANREILKEILTASIAVPSKFLITAEENGLLLESIEESRVATFVARVGKEHLGDYKWKRKVSIMLDPQIITNAFRLYEDKERDAEIKLYENYGEINIGPLNRVFRHEGESNKLHEQIQKVEGNMQAQKPGRIGKMESSVLTDYFKAIVEICSYSTTLESTAKTVKLFGNFKLPGEEMEIDMTKLMKRPEKKVSCRTTFFQRDLYRYLDKLERVCNDITIYSKDDYPLTIVGGTSLKKVKEFNPDTLTYLVIIAPIIQHD